MNECTETCENCTYSIDLNMQIDGEEVLECSLTGAVHDTDYECVMFKRG